MTTMVGIEGSVSTRKAEADSLGQLRKWIAVHFGSYATTTTLEPPRQFSVEALAGLFERRANAGFGPTEVASYLQGMRGVGAAEVGIGPSGVWALLHGAADPANPEGATGYEQPTLVITLAGHAAVVGAQVAVAPRVLDPDAGGWFPKERVLASVGEGFRGPTTDPGEIALVGAVAAAMCDVLQQERPLTPMS